jgi:DNA-binding CsgD family transcriptional regulator
MSLHRNHLEHVYEKLEVPNRRAARQLRGHSVSERLR